jgi:hypothetical protein
VARDSSGRLCALDCEALGGDQGDRLPELVGDVVRDHQARARARMAWLFSSLTPGGDARAISAAKARARSAWSMVFIEPGKRRPRKATAPGVCALPAMIPGRKISTRSNPTARTVSSFRPMTRTERRTLVLLLPTADKRQK